MEYKKYGDQIIIRLDKGEELISLIAEICKKEDIMAASVQGIGYTDDIEVRIYDNRCNEFKFQSLTGPMEITNLCGNVVMADNGIYPHLHIMAADENMKIRGGHLVSCKIAAVAEVVLDILPGTLRRGISDDLHLGTLRFQ